MTPTDENRQQAPPPPPALSSSQAHPLVLPPENGPSSPHPVDIASGSYQIPPPPPPPPAGESLVAYTTPMQPHAGPFYPASAPTGYPYPPPPANNPYPQPQPHNSYPPPPSDGQKHQYPPPGDHYNQYQSNTQSLNAPSGYPQGPNVQAPPPAYMNHGAAQSGGNQQPQKPQNEPNQSNSNSLLVALAACLGVCVCCEILF